MYEYRTSSWVLTVSAVESSCCINGVNSECLCISVQILSDCSFEMMVSKLGDAIHP